MKKYLLSVGAVISMVVLAVAVPIQAKVTAGDVTGGVKAPHVNIAIFHKLHGQDAFVYPKRIASQGNRIKKNKCFIIFFQKTPIASSPNAFIGDPLNL